MITRLLEAVTQTRALAVSWVQRYPRHILVTLAAVALGGTGATFAVANLAPEDADLPRRTVVEDVTALTTVSLNDTVHDQALRLYRFEQTRSSDTVESLLKRLGVFDPSAVAFLRQDRVVQQVLIGRGGRNVTVEAAPDQSLLRLVARWSPENDGMFKRLTVERTPEGFQSRLETLPMTVSARMTGGVIQSSLFAATDDARIPDSVAVQMADIFSGDIDFHRALRKGDRFTVTYETLEADGEPLRAGRVLHAEFVNAGKPFQAMWFQEPLATQGGSASAGSQSVKGGYYTLAGESLRRAFLASPLEFSRVTSGFKMRFHPIMKTWRAHLGVDYGAPNGTPVRVVGDGVVEFAGVQNGFGNVVMVKHGNTNKTVYAHLSRINVRSGQSVSQGQHVGAVGQTGWATGPHLHFEFRVNGAHRDPLTLARQSESTPVTASARPAFNQAAALVRVQLAAAANLLPGSAQ